MNVKSLLVVGFIGLAGTVLFSSSSPPIFCSCPPMPFSHYYDQATHIFACTAISVDTISYYSNPIRGTYPNLVEFTVVVSERFKFSDRSDTLRLRTNAFESMCGYHFEFGSPYLVFAVGEKDPLFTSMCRGNKPLSNAKEYLDSLKAKQ